MDNLTRTAGPVARGEDIIKGAESVGLDPRLLYEAVIDLSNDGLHTANCINIAAGILIGTRGRAKAMSEIARIFSLQDPLGLFEFSDVFFPPLITILPASFVPCLCIVR